MSGASLAVLVAGLPDLYQPVFGHPELSSGPTRVCEDRLTYITGIYRSLEAVLGRPPRVLDLGCAQGFFTLHLAKLGGAARGVDFADFNIAVCKALADENPGLPVMFEVGRIEDVLVKVKPDEVDLVLGLSVLHHVTHDLGTEAVRRLMDELAEKIGVGIFEMAAADEPTARAASQTGDPRRLLDGFKHVGEVARIPTQMAGILRDAGGERMVSYDRPLYVASSRYHFVPN